MVGVAGLSVLAHVPTPPVDSSSSHRVGQKKTLIPLFHHPTSSGGLGFGSLSRRRVLVFLPLRVVLVILTQRDSTSSHTVWVLHRGSSCREKGCADLAISVRIGVGIVPTVVVGVYVLLKNG